MSEEKHYQIPPLFENIKTKNSQILLADPIWNGLDERGVLIRQMISKEIGLSLWQREGIKRGILTITGCVTKKKFLNSLKQLKVGKDEIVENELVGFVEKVVTLINFVNKALGELSISSLRLCRGAHGSLTYYTSFNAERMELILRMGTCEDIDGASVTHLPRSSVDEETRKWEELLKQLPLEIQIPIEVTTKK